MTYFFSTVGRPPGRGAAPPQRANGSAFHACQCKTCLHCLRCYPRHEADYTRSILPPCCTARHTA
eukprot:4452095-Prymnesium_polylepis.1